MFAKRIVLLENLVEDSEELRSTMEKEGVFPESLITDALYREQGDTFTCFDIVEGEVLYVNDSGTGEDLNLDKATYNRWMSDGVIEEIEDVEE